MPPAIKIVNGKKLCNKCGRTLPIDKFRKDGELKCGYSCYCIECWNKKNVLWRKEHLEKSRQQGRECAKRRLIRLREIVLKYYGKRCACCEESNEKFLTVDHIDGKGAEHRKSIAKETGANKNGRNISSIRMYAWIIKNNFPALFQILCYNCNCARGFRGSCH